MKFNNIRLLVQDFDTCFTFYNKTLGLKCTHGALGTNFASFDIGIKNGLAIFRSELMNDAIGNDSGPEKSTSDKFAIVIEVESVDKTVTLLKKKKIEFINEAKD